MRPIPRTVTALLLLLGLSFTVVLAAGRALGIAAAPLAVGLLGGMSLAFFATRALRRRKAAPRSRAPRTLPAHRVGRPGYDLAKDKTTDGQRWLM
jgi:hypothetical protein